MRVPFAGLVLLATLLAPAFLASAPAPPPRSETRALWVVRTSLTSPSSVTDMVSAAKAAGFNALFVQVRGRGDAYYASRVEPRAAALSREPEGFNPLGLVIREAHAAGLAVHAWINVSLVADAADIPVAKHHVVHRHPDWLMVPRDLVPSLGRMSPKDARFVPRLAAWTRGQSAAVEGLFLSPLNAAAADHVLRVVDDIVTHYAVDGVHFDYIRFPGAQFDYSRTALTAFASEVSRGLSRREKREMKARTRSNPLAYVERYPATWQDFRRGRLTALLRRLRARVLAKRPGTFVSAAVVPDAAVARDSRGQDWPSWLNQGLLDAVCPMAYTTDADTFRQQMAVGRAASPGRLFLAGIGAYRLSPDQTMRRIDLAREAGADGFILFSYDSLTAPDRGGVYLEQIGRAMSVR